MKALSSNNLGNVNKDLIHLIYKKDTKFVSVQFFLETLNAVPKTRSKKLTLPFKSIWRNVLLVNFATALFKYISLVLLKKFSQKLKTLTVRKVAVFGVILASICPHSD